ncbi:MAG TPA: CDGSH iron-sulfur domain-containing protein [Clostridia bacterium]|nr:CDGSH iron-sulfur domain-containing protein [Clostridia bacterium]
MGNVKIKVLDDGPFLVNGDVEILDGTDKAITKPEQYALCRCGLSTNMPFCTGAHHGKLHSEVRAK